MRHLAPLPRRPGGGMWPNGPRGAPWHPSEIGAALVFFGRVDPDQLTLTGSAVNVLANDGGTGTAATSAPGAEHLYDVTVPLGGHGAIRTTNAGVLAGTGGPTGTSPWYVMIFAQILGQGSAGGQPGTFFSLGTPTLSGASGIGTTDPANGDVMWCGGFGNPIIQQAAAAWKTDARLYELINTGAALELHENLGLVASVSGATDLAADGGRFGWRGCYEPLPSIYGAVEALTYLVAVINGIPTDDVRNQLAEYAHRRLMVTPRMLVVIIGDSTVYGRNPGAGTTHADVEDMAELYAMAGTPIDFINAGVSSQTTGEILDRVPALLDYLGTQGANYRRVVFIARGGYNNTGFGLDAPAAVADLVAMCSQVKARSSHFETYIGTSFGGVGISAEAKAFFDQVNALIVAGGPDFTPIDYRDLVPDPITTAELPDSIHQSAALFELQALRNIEVIG